MMTAKEMHEHVEFLKEQVLLNGFKKTSEVEKFLDENWMQILDILDDALWEYLNKEKQ